MEASRLRSALTLERVVMSAAMPVTAGMLRKSGVDVTGYEGDEVSVVRINGLMCGTRALLRDERGKARG